MIEGRWDNVNINNEVWGSNKMTEEKPYNDEEFEGLKVWLARVNKELPYVAIDKFNSLIATVESLKEKCKQSDQLNEMLIEGQLDLQKEVESLKFKYRVSRKIITDRVKQTKELKEENDKLKAQLDAALKRIEEMK